MTSPIEIISVSEMTAADQAAIAASTPGEVLMERAGSGAAEAILARWTPRPTTVLCGPGNNGGDGFVIARKLAEAGWHVRAALAGDRAALKGDAARAADRGPGETVPAGQTAVEGAGLVVDALFGAGLARPLSADLQTLLRAAEASGAALVAVDLPSGLPGDAAEPLGYAPRCDLTVTFHRKKPAHVLCPGRDLCGEIVLIDIGLSPPRGGALFENAPALWDAAFPRPDVSAHKHSRGSLVVVSGPASRTGAARLAATAGLRIGAGLSTVLSPPGAVMVNAAHLTAVMLQAFSSPDNLAGAARDAAAAVIGPAAGVGSETRANVEALAGTHAALILDADVFSVFRDDPEALFALVDEADVMTPHPGEFERVFPGLLKGSPTRIEAAREGARRSGAVVLLKGPDTVIAAPDGRAAVNTNASPYLATAGSGDVLAGFIGGLAAQGMPAFEAACAGAWIHGEAGRMSGPGLISEDLERRVPEILEALLAPNLAAN